MKVTVGHEKQHTKTRKGNLGKQTKAKPRKTHENKIMANQQNKMGKQRRRGLKKKRMEDDTGKGNTMNEGK
jgi:hypothetical protein